MAYVTKQQVKTYLQIDGTDQDTLLDLLIESAEKFLENRTGRKWGSSPHEVTDEVYDYEPILWLNNMDITDVTSVKLGNPQTGTPTELDSNGYNWSESGRISLGWQYGHVGDQHDYDYVQVSYKHTAGEFPADLKLALLQVIAVFYNQSEGAGRTITRERLGNLDTQYASLESSLADRPDLLGTIDSYRRYRI